MELLQNSNITSGADLTSLTAICLTYYTEKAAKITDQEFTHLKRSIEKKGFRKVNDIVSVSGL